jgi:hypothetical protein
MFARSLLILPVLCIGGMLPESLVAQSADLPRFGLGVSGSSLGVGVQAATAVTHRANVRVGGNFFNFRDDLTKDGVNYAAKLKLRSAQATFDQYIKGGFHISPGVLIYNGNTASANIAVPSGQSFSLGNTTYYSSQANPLGGAGGLNFNKVAPMILVGFGNMLPRSQRHFGLNFEVGGAYQGSPKASLNVNGFVCPFSDAQSNCLNAATDPTVQANVQSERTKINNNVSAFKFFPVVSLTLSYKFGHAAEK